MSCEDPSRRAFLAATGASLGAALLATTPEQLKASLEHARRRAAPAQQAFEVLTTEQAADIDALAAQIIPADEALPGAREAGAVHFLDHSLTTWAQGQRQPLLDGLTAFNAQVAQTYPGLTRFAQLSPTQQLEFLGGHERDGFFQQVRFAVLLATFSNPLWGGNVGKIGYRILGFEDRFQWQPPFGWYDARANGGPN
jgi:gluconate 2-dehydrogenase gamma chain